MMDDTDSLPEQFSVAVNVIDSSIYGDCELTINCTGKRFKVLITPDFSPLETIEGRLIKRFGSAMKFRDDDELSDLEDELSDLLTRIPLPRNNLLMLVAIEGRVQVIPNTDAKDRCPKALWIDLEDNNLPRFNAADLIVHRQFLTNRIVEVRDKQGGVYLCKIANAETRKAVGREFECPKRVAAEVGKNGAWRVPRLSGLVYAVNPADGGKAPAVVIGILETLIRPASQQQQRDGVLHHLNVEVVEQSRKEKWVEQLRETMCKLHAIGVVWGDAKAGNVIIDEGDDAWVIDFGGSWTDGWFEAGVAGTVEGDEMGLRRIEEWLGAGRRGGSGSSRAKAVGHVDGVANGR
ncbi:hypothetical protein K402DRAFT_458874 [Aulographum hederae CBS 113979]|uniref:Protein kinase domain-containing protein n=1 Tax=Aulographum hederae CBS 113979 TaxID=1176131 RepID=A0A6G1HH28_9PEZI|nr:hypothetical protein K402DRAFT_458874 [Aulographum hederae CBS 113979]